MSSYRCFDRKTIGLTMKRNELTTLCYIERGDSYLMMHRTKKENDINKDKYVGVGGHFEGDESPEECVKREIFEETGFDVDMKDLRFRALITFVSDKGDYELMSLFTIEIPDGEPTACNEGDLVWVKKSDVYDLNLWEGDRIFFRLMEESMDFFSLKMAYDAEDNLRQVLLNGEEIRA